MLFSSPVFLFLFLPLVILIYYLSPKKFKNLVLLLFSLGFYTWGEKEMVILILISAIVDFFCGLIIQRGHRKVGLIISLMANLGVLIYFKYAFFIFENSVSFLGNINISASSYAEIASITLPLGISFFTFQTMSYTIDVYYGKVKANKNFIDFALFVSFFPQLIAGPIVRYSEIHKSLKIRKTSLTLFSEGIKRFIVGLSKKMIIANNCGFLADGMFDISSNELSASMAWLGLLAYSFQIYFDFSGYSDMAIGLGKMFGFNFPENFNFPYISKSIREFWQRWHITLSNWFKDYLYIPLGGSREGNKRTYINLIIVFFLTGLWHGANWTFIIWGIMHGSLIVLERFGLKRLFSKIPVLFSHVYLILAVMLTWVIFRCESLEHALNYYNALFSYSKSINLDYLYFYLNIETLTAMILAILLSIPIVDILKKTRYFKILSAENKIALKSCAVFLLLVVDFIYIANESYNPFIYFRF